MDLLLWQLADSAFPAGGFAHSAGLEAATQQGEIAGWLDLERFARAAIKQSGRGALPLMTAAYDAPQTVRDLDALCDVFLTNPIANRASRTLGQAFVTGCARSFPGAPIDQLQEAISRSEIRGHHAPMFGAVLRALAIGRRPAQRLFLFLIARAIASAGVRLAIIGAYDAQRLQALMGPEIDDTLTRCAELHPFEIAQTAPLIDLFQSTHDRLYSKLFQS